jgi:hypothetical protein
MAMFVYDRNGVEGQLRYETMARSCHKVYTLRDLIRSITTTTSAAMAMAGKGWQLPV